ncbi:MAG TPA: hypothetical protein VIV58_38225 [Kofleriaceae bacterium]
MSGWVRATREALGRTAFVAAVVAVVAGIAGVASGLGEADRPRTFAVLIATWLFFAGLTAGALAVRALFAIVDARWARPLVAPAGALLGFAPVALGLLVVILLGAGSWLRADAGSAWMSSTAVAIRELALTSALFGCGFLSRSPARTRRFATGYLIAFGIVGSLWAFDLVLGADATFESTLIGVFVFASAFCAATALVILLGVRRDLLAEKARRDAGALVVALAIFWAYLFWSQYLTIWYGNLPDEVAFALRRAEGGWGVVVLAVIGLVFATPFALLLHPAGRRSVRILRAALGTQLFGFWLACELLIVPSLTPGDAPVIAIRDVLVALGMCGAFALSVARGLMTSFPERKNL